MVQPPIAPIIPNLGGQPAAVAGSSAAIFTATDRKIIEERTGEIDKKRSFQEVFKQKPLATKVENELTSVKPEPSVNELEERYREHRRMLKHSTLAEPRERVEVAEEAKIDPEVHHETAALAKELKLDYHELHTKFSIEQEELFSLISRIKELHLKRLLSENPKEFELLSEKIKNETLAAAMPNAKPWVKAQMDKLTKDAADYKIGILTSLQAMEFNADRKKTIKWLKKIVSNYSK